MIDTISPKWTIEIHKVFNYSWRWDFLCPEKVNIHLNRKAHDFCEDERSFDVQK